jgi:hypothetical protein
MSEHDEQKAVVNYCRVAGLKVAAVPNGFFSGARNAAAYINKRKAEGMSPGFPDLMVFKRGNSKILFIEMKKDAKSKASDEQAAWIEFLSESGHSAKVCFGADDAIEFIKVNL